MCFLGKFSNFDFKRNIIDVTLMPINGASIFTRKSISWAKYQYVARTCALKSWNSPQVAPAPGIWRIEIQTSAWAQTLSDATLPEGKIYRFSDFVTTVFVVKPVAWPESNKHPIWLQQF